MASGIYTIQSPSNRIYIGQSTNLERRETDYALLRCKEQPLIYRSLKKYGFDAHQFNVILELKEDISQSQLNYWEQFFMDFYRNEGYPLLNLKDAGARGKMSEETKLKMRLAKQYTSEETRKKIGDAHRGRKRPPETGRKIAASKVNLKNSEAWQRNIERLKSLKGQKMSEEAKANMRANSSHHKNSPEHIAKLIAINTTRKRSPEEQEQRNWAISNLTYLQVRIIIHCIEFGMTSLQLGRIFKVSKSSISDIKFGRIFKKIPRAIQESQNHTLNESQIRIIKHCFELDGSRGLGIYLSRAFNTSPCTISEIRKGKRWKKLINN